jgi:hypothetical protein
MTKINRIIILFLAAAVTAVFIPPPVNAQPARNISDLRDVSPDDWFYESVKRLYEDGIINGVSANSYAPDAEVRISEIAALVVRYMGNVHLAARAKETQRRNNTPGADLWYSGYIQVICDMGIFRDADIERYGLHRTGAGLIHIPANAAAALEAPAKRTDAAKFIARSFEIRLGRTQGNAILRREVSGRGHVYITGGGYDDATLEKIKPMIRDYNSIPAGYHMYFLKCYYNGIMRGNERGEVLPNNNLKRSELARIIASVIYFDMRNPDIRELAPQTAVTAGDYVASSIDGSRILRQSKADQILREQAKLTRLSELEDRVSVTVVQHNIIPMGFFAEVYLYFYAGGGGVWEVGRVNASANAHPYFPKENSFSILKSGRTGNTDVGYIYFLLRDIQRDGEIAGAVMFNITADGTMRDTSVYYLP